MSKTERIVFSGKGEGFSYLKEQIEARIFHLKLNKILHETVDYRNLMPSLRPIVPALDERSVLFLRPYKGNGSKAWDVLRKRLKSFERPRLQKLISELRTFKKNSNETVIDYLTRAEEIQYNLEQVNEAVSEKFSIILQGLPKEFEISSNIAKCSRDEKSLDELERDLVNFDSERQVIEKEMLLIARTEFVLNVKKEDVLK